MVCHPVICQRNFVLGPLFMTDRQDIGATLTFRLVELLPASAPFIIVV